MSQEAIAWAFRQKPRNAAEKLLLIGLAQFHSPGVEELAGEKLEVEYLASYALCTVRNISRLLNSLQEQEYLDVQRCQGTRNKYILNFEKDEVSEALVYSSDNLSGVRKTPNPQEKLSTSDNMSDDSQDNMSDGENASSDNMSSPTDNMSDVIGQNVRSHRTNCPGNNNKYNNNSNKGESENDEGVNYVVPMHRAWKPDENFSLQLIKNKIPADFYTDELLTLFHDYWMDEHPTIERKTHASWQKYLANHVKYHYDKKSKSNQATNTPDNSRGRTHGNSASTGTDQLQAAREAARQKLREQREREIAAGETEAC